MSLQFHLTSLITVRHQAMKRESYELRTPIFFVRNTVIALMMEAVRTCETSVYFETTWRYIPEGCSLINEYIFYSWSKKTKFY
jgi:hypothetical protein